MRIAIRVGRQQADDAHEIRDALALLPAGGEIVQPDGFADDVTYIHARVERGIRILEDDLQVPPQLAQLALIELQDRASLIAHIACSRLDQAQQKAAQGGLAAARLTHNGEGLAATDAERHAVDGTHDGGRGE